MSCIYDYDSPCECDIDACRTCYKNPDKPKPDCDFMESSWKAVKTHDTCRP